MSIFPVSLSSQEPPDSGLGLHYLSSPEGGRSDIKVPPRLDHYSVDDNPTDTGTQTYPHSHANTQTHTHTHTHTHSQCVPAPIPLSALKMQGKAELQASLLG